MLSTTCHLLRCYLNITYLNMPSPKSMCILFHATYLVNEMTYNNKNEVIKYKYHQLCLRNALNSHRGFQICCAASLWHPLMSERKFINKSPQLAPVLHYHHCSLSETLKCLHVFISPGTWICLLYFLLSSKCVWKRKQGLDVAHLYHFPSSFPVFLCNLCVD